MEFYKRQNNRYKEESKKLNEFLDILQSKIYEARLRLIEKNEIVTSDLLKNVLMNKEEKHHPLLETFKEHNIRMETLIINKEYAEGTLTL